MSDYLLEVGEENILCVCKPQDYSLYLTGLQKGQVQSGRYEIKYLYQTEGDKCHCTSCWLGDLASCTEGNGNILVCVYCDKRMVRARPLAIYEYIKKRNSREGIRAKARSAEE